MVLNPFGGAGVGRATRWRIVLKAAVFGRIVRRSNDNAIREAAPAIAVVGKDGVRERRSRGVSAGIVDHDLNVISGQDFQSGNKGGLR